MPDFGQTCRELADTLIRLAGDAPDEHKPKIGLAATLVGLTALDVELAARSPVTVEQQDVAGGLVGLVDAIGW